MSYNPLANEKYANLMMAIEDAATLNKEEIKEWLKPEVPIMKLTTMKDMSDSDKDTYWPRESPNNML